MYSVESVRGSSNGDGANLWTLPGLRKTPRGPKRESAFPRLVTDSCLGVYRSPLESANALPTSAHRFLFYIDLSLLNKREKKEKDIH